jgi:hypothetical protein
LAPSQTSCTIPTLFDPNPQAQPVVWEFVGAVLPAPTNSVALSGCDLEGNGQGGVTGWLHASSIRNCYYESATGPFVQVPPPQSCKGLEISNNYISAWGPNSVSSEFANPASYAIDLNTNSGVLGLVIEANYFAGLPVYTGNWFPPGASPPQGRPVAVYLASTEPIFVGGMVVEGGVCVSDWKETTRVSDTVRVVNSVLRAGGQLPCHDTLWTVTMTPTGLAPTSLAGTYSDPDPTKNESFTATLLPYGPIRAAMIGDAVIRANLYNGPVFANPMGSAGAFIGFADGVLYSGRPVDVGLELHTYRFLLDTLESQPAGPQEARLDSTATAACLAIQLLHAGYVLKMSGFLDGTPISGVSYDVQVFANGIVQVESMGISSQTFEQLADIIYPDPALLTPPGTLASNNVVQLVVGSEITVLVTLHNFPKPTPQQPQHALFVDVVVGFGNTGG